MKVIKKELIYILIFSFIISFILLLVGFFYLEKGNNLYVTIFQGIKIVISVIILILIIKFKMKVIIFGFSLVLLAWIWNFIASIFAIDTALFDYINLAVYEFFSLIAIVLLQIGILRMLKRNNLLVNKLEKLAFYDSLTNLPNRNMLLDYCPLNNQFCDGKSCACNERKRIVESNRLASVLFIDVDDFKNINDSLGHYYGDLLLKQIANRLKGIADDEDMIVHLSGDEFLLIAFELDIGIKLELKLLHILNSLAQPYKINNKEVVISASIGVAVYPADGPRMNDVIEKADMAMYQAKSIGKNCFFIYNSDLDFFLKNKYEMINDLKSSILKNDFVIYYQPIADCKTNEVMGLEALVRWNHPTKGIVYPNTFVPIAEEIGVIKEIDLIVMKKVCEQIVKWQQNGEKVYNVSINISPVLFNDPNFLTKIDSIISLYKIEPSNISIEITENVAFHNVEETKIKLNEMFKRDIKVYLDDFGTGYSSMLYLKQYIINFIKIDRSFITAITDNETDRALVNTLCYLSEQLNFKVVAEGIETLDQLNIIQKLGCHYYQGYLLSKPVPIEELEKNLINMANYLQKREEN